MLGLIHMRGQTALYIEKERVRSPHEVFCPKCLAQPGEPCWVLSGKREGKKANHYHKLRGRNAIFKEPM